MLRQVGRVYIHTGWDDCGRQFAEFGLAHACLRYRDGTSAIRTDARSPSFRVIRMPQGLVMHLTFGVAKLRADSPPEVVAYACTNFDRWGRRVFSVGVMQGAVRCGDGAVIGTINGYSPVFAFVREGWRVLAQLNWRGRQWGCI